MPELIPLNHQNPGPLAKRFEEFMSSRIIGQERALRYFARVMELHKAGSRDFHRPVYCVLLAGPSGVGKTMTAEALAEFFFEDPSAFTKVACADYNQSHDIAALIGSPPGYVGFWSPGDRQNSGSEPILSQFGIDQYDYFYQLQKSENSDSKNAAKRLKELVQRQQLLVPLLFTLGEQAIIEKDSKKKKNGNSDSMVRTKEEIIDGEVTRIHSVKTDRNAAMTKIINELAQIQAEISNLRKTAHSQRQEYSPENNYRSVILFDEIEKANPALHKLLLEIMDKGQVTLKNGMITRFTNSFIIMTSNVGSDEIDKVLNQKGLGFRSAKALTAAGSKDQNVYESVMRSLEKVFPPEFRGRLDNVIVFRPLERRHLLQILELEVKKLHGRLLAAQLPIIIKIDDKAKKFLLDKSSEKRTEEGARLLRKRVEGYLEENLCRMKNNGELVEGDIIHVTVEETDNDSKIRFFREERKASSQIAH